jgi:hypothetical protein
VGVDSIADQAERALEIAPGGAERIRVDRERGADYDQRRAIFRGADGLLKRQASDRLHGNAHGGDHFAELIQRARHPPAGGRNPTALVVANVMNDEVAAEVLDLPGPRDHIGAA